MVSFISEASNFPRSVFNLIWSVQFDLKGVQFGWKSVQFDVKVVLVSNPWFFRCVHSGAVWWSEAIPLPTHPGDKASGSGCRGGTTADSADLRVKKLRCLQASWDWTAIFCGLSTSTASMINGFYDYLLLTPYAGWPAREPFCHRCKKSWLYCEVIYASDSSVIFFVRFRQLSLCFVRWLSKQCALFSEVGE